MHPLGFRVRRVIGLVSFQTANSKGKILLIITVHSAIAYFARRQECLSESICRIALKNFLESVPTKIPSRMDWEET